MNLGPNFNNRKLFTGESKSTTRSINMERFKERTGARSIDEVRNSRMKLNEQVSKNKYGYIQKTKYRKSIYNIA